MQIACAIYTPTLRDSQTAQLGVIYHLDYLRNKHYFFCMKKLGKENDFGFGMAALPARCRTFRVKERAVDFHNWPAHQRQKSKEAMIP